MGEQGGEGKKDVAQTTLGAALKVIQVELAEQKQVLVDKHIGNPEGELLVHECKFVSAAAVEHDHWNAKHEQADE